MNYYIKKYLLLLLYYIREYREEVKTGLIAFVITILTYSFLNYSYKTVEEIEPVEIEIPEVDQDFIDDIRGALEEPDIISDTNEQFIASLDTCIDYVYLSVSPERQLPRKLILAQAILESAWGTSRFANEGNNLFGIRTFDKSQEHLLPITWDPNEWPGWGVKVYESKCASVRDYVRIINEVWAYEELREARKQNPDITAVELAMYLDKFSTNPNYENLVVRIIETKL
jgi:Bax protein